MDSMDNDVVICTACRNPIEGYQVMVSTLTGVYHGAPKTCQPK